MRGPAYNFRRGDSLQAVSSPARVGDDEWDAFLASTSLGQFQQCSAWARYKLARGWQSSRVVVRQDESIVGGAQVLWRTSWFGRIGFVNKGPVVAPETAAAVTAAVLHLRRLARELGLRALVIQAPDFSVQTAPVLIHHGCFPERVLGVINATLLADLTGGWQAVCHRMSRTTVQRCRQAAQRGLSVRSGGWEDLRTFFGLMKQTCVRQGEKRVNPASAAELESLWSALAPHGMIRLWLAEHEGRSVAGLLGIIFGKRLTLWKKGWNGEHADRRPNEALAAASFRWGSEDGCTIADFVGMDRQLAGRLLAGGHSRAEALDSRHMFNLRLGGRPALLPESMIWFPHPLLAWGCSRLAVVYAAILGAFREPRLGIVPASGHTGAF